MDQAADAQLVAAIHRGQLVEHCRSRPLEVATRAVRACEAIGLRVDDELRAATALLGAAGVHVADPAPSGPRQHHTGDLDFPGADDALAARDVLAASGYEPWERWTAGAAESFRRNATHCTVVRSDDVTTVLRLRWGPAEAPSTVRRLVRPTMGDWGLVALPRPLWWSYPAVRVVRLTAERLGLRRPFRSGLGPFLGTPTELVGPLLAFGGLRDDDHVADIGCGDGRIAIAAAEAGATATGIEIDAGLVVAARAAAAASPAAERIRIEQRDVDDADAAALGDATLIVMFLPTDAIEWYLPRLFDRLRPGARVVVHEQRPLPPALRPPDETRPIIGEAALTVAHRWTI